jgi:hypothetical protein
LSKSFGFQEYYVASRVEQFRCTEWTASLSAGEKLPRPILVPSTPIVLE